VTDLFKTLTSSKGIQSLLFGWLIPVAVGATAFVIVLYPRISKTRGMNALRNGMRHIGVGSAAFFVIAIVVAAILLSLNSRTLYQLLEGLTLWPKFLRNRRIRVHRLQWDVLDSSRRLAEAEASLRKFDDVLYELRSAIPVTPKEAITQAIHWKERAEESVNEAEVLSNWAIFLRNNRSRLRPGKPPKTRYVGIGRLRRKVPFFVLSTLEEYGGEPKDFLPTRLGNLMKAFESYGYTMYRLDSQTFWYELTSLVPKELLDATSDARIGTDFYVAFLYVAFGLTLAAAAIGVASGSTSSLVAAVIALILIPIIHERIRRSIEEWRFAVQAVINAGRLPLAQALGLDLPDSLAEERRMWNALTGFVQYRSDLWASRLDRFRSRK